MVIVLMGVAGSGKTTVGRQLAERLYWSFADADDFHPPQNIAKMSAGQPLNDADRAPWLAAIRKFIDGQLAAGTNAVVTCSALKQRYREQIQPDPVRVKLVYLEGSRELLLARLRHRHGHFMKPDMLDSQLATLEPPTDALTLDVAPPPSQLVDEIRAAFGV